MRFQFTIHDLDFNTRFSRIIEDTEDKAKSEASEVIQAFDKPESGWIAIPGDGFKMILNLGCAFIFPIA